MRTRILWLLGAVVVGLVLGGIAQFPAARAVAWVDPAGVHAAGVQGSLWRGRAERVQVPDAPPATGVSWDVSPWQLLLGRLAGRVEFDVGGGSGHARFRLSRGGGLELADAELRTTAAGIARHLPVPLLLVEGDITAVMEQGALRAGRPVGIDARLRWDRAAVRQPLDVLLGAVTLAIAPQTDGGHRLTLDGRDGVLAIDGRGDVTADGRYNLEIRIEPTAEAGPRVTDVLAGMATREGDVYVIRESGQLPSASR